MIRADEPDDNPAIELTPIIDMVFLLLIFFLVATTFQRAELEMSIALPETQSGGPITRALREIVVNITDNGTIVVSGAQVSPVDLESMIRTAIDVNPDQKVTVRGDRAVLYDSVIQVLDICRRAGIQEPYLDTILSR